MVEIEVPDSVRLPYEDIDYKPTVASVLRVLMRESTDIREFERYAIERGLRTAPMRSQMEKACDFDAAFKMVETVGLDYEGFVAFANRVRQKAGLEPLKSGAKKP